MCLKNRRVIISDDSSAESLSTYLPPSSFLFFELDHCFFFLHPIYQLLDNWELSSEHQQRFSLLIKSNRDCSQYLPHCRHFSLILHLWNVEHLSIGPGSVTAVCVPRSPPAPSPQDLSFHPHQSSLRAPSLSGPLAALRSARFASSSFLLSSRFFLDSSALLRPADRSRHSSKGIKLIYHSCLK